MKHFFRFGFRRVVGILAVAIVLFAAQGMRVMAASGLALDPSTPPTVKGNSQVLTTATFTPPAGSELYVAIALNSKGDNKVDSINGGGLIFTKQGSYGMELGDDSLVYLYTASVKKSQPMQVTVYQRSNAASNAAMMNVLVVDGANSADPVGAIGGARGTDGLINDRLNSTVVGSWIWLLYADHNAAAVPTVGLAKSVYDSYNASGIGTYALMERNATTTEINTAVDMDTHSPSSGVQVSHLYFEMIPAALGQGSGSGSGGSGSGGSVSVAPSILSFSASPSSINSGQSTTLSWSVSGVPTSTVSINNGVGSVTGNSVVVSPQLTSTYVLTAANSAGTVTAQTTVMVLSPSASSTSSTNPNPIVNPQPVPVPTSSVPIVGPSIPANLTVLTVTSDTVSLTWSPSVDPLGIAGYEFYRNGNLTVIIANTAHTDTRLMPSTTYNYSVAAIDKVGNVSAQSPMVEATTKGINIVLPKPTPITATGVAGAISNGGYAMTLDANDATYAVEANNALFVKKLGAALDPSEIQNGDSITVYGTLLDGVITAAKVRDLSLSNHKVVVVGKVQSVASSSFVTATSTETDTIMINSTTTFVQGGNLVTFANVIPGETATVNAVWDRVPNILIASQVAVTISQFGVNPIPSTFFGMNDGYTNVADLPTSEGMQMGFFGHPSEFAWIAMEPSRGVYNFTTYDQFVNAAPKDANGNAEIIITFARTPGWAVADQSKCVTKNGYTACHVPPDNMQDWTDFVTAVMNHYNGITAPHVKYYELWNEANNANFWTGTPQQLAAMAKIATPIIHQDPNSLVIGPSTTLDATWQAFMTQFANAGGLKGVDMASYHIYPGPEDPSEWQMGSMATHRAVFDQLGMTGKPMINSEGSWGNANVTDPDLQEAFVARYFLLQASVYTTDNLTMSSWYTWGRGVTGNAWGIIETASDTPTGAGQVYNEMYNWLVGNRTAPCTKSGNIWSCNILTSAGAKEQAVWDASQTCSNGTCTTSSFTIPSGYTTYETLTGSVMNVPSTRVIPLGIKPVLLK